MAREGGSGVYIYIYMLKGDGRGRGLIFFTVEREGVEVNVFFSPSFDMCKEEGKRVSSFRKTFFSLLNG